MLQENPDPARIGQCVTASQLVRNFGHWQLRAEHDPVFVLHRGKPRLALLSIDMIEALGASASGQDRWEIERGTILDAVRDIVLVLDDACQVRAANAAARAHFAFDPGRHPVPLSAIAPANLAVYLDDAARRVASARIGERIELGSAGGANRLAITIAPLPHGVVIVAHDLRGDDACDLANAALSGIDAALAELNWIATVRINPRGYLTEATSSLERLTNLPASVLSSVRFVSLIDVAARVAVADAIDRVVAGAPSTHVGAGLLVNGVGVRAAQIGLGALPRRLSVEGVQAVIVLRGDG